MQALTQLGQMKGLETFINVLLYNYIHDEHNL